ncbi:mitochondrial outer membrane protein (Sam35) [Pochonia chlamydosporia 170]|uniref:Mitochondrial outer membrane protein (Sam35) n=1 Tax=Pochonia chlamydosporia 170 TaxID=1380566 RepID=A0A179F8V6_METCM|nr:mitochondrial outer membrane protein (Sam35) [Pochonia chlamydosporia 170]OAQ61858.1 mitochondrial outer membrane protein (Sam35) [Pochonia chlamydosporia 170]
MATTTSSSIFTIPTPIRSLFNLFPLQTYDAEPLPARSPSESRTHAKLHIFSIPEDALLNRPSFNPTCLKWQTYLRIANIRTDLIPSTNHASPSGSLPYLLPPSTDSRPDIPLTGHQISQYAQKNSSLRDAPSPKAEAYLSLIAQSIRPAWLYALYLSPTHTSLLTKLYLPSSPLLSTPLLHTLRSAAREEILKATRRHLLLPGQLYDEARTAFEALDTALGKVEWFFGGSEPGLFDAEVFAYTYLILDTEFGWQDDELRDCVGGCENLVAHRRRLYERCWN